MRIGKRTSPAGAAEIDAMLYAKRPLMSDAMLRVFFEAYEIVADVLRDAPADIGEKELTQLALGVGKQYVAQGRVRSSEPVSTLLFDTARQVVADQDLLEPGAGSGRAPRRVSPRIAGHPAGFRPRRADRAQAVRRPRGRGTRCGTPVGGATVRFGL